MQYKEEPFVRLLKHFPPAFIHPFMLHLSYMICVILSLVLESEIGFGKYPVRLCASAPLRLSHFLPHFLSRQEGRVRRTKVLMNSSIHSSIRVPSHPRLLHFEHPPLQTPPHPLISLPRRLGTRSPTHTPLIPPSLP